MGVKILGVGAVGIEVVRVDTAPVPKLTRFRVGVLPEKNSPAVKEGSGDGYGGKMSDWNESDCTVQVKGFHFIDKTRPTFRGTMNAIGSIADVVTLYARAISHSVTSNARRGRKHIPRCCSEALDSSRKWRVALGVSLPEGSSSAS